MLMSLVCRVCVVCSYKAHPIMQKWPGYQTFKKRELASKKGMFM